MSDERLQDHWSSGLWRIDKNYPSVIIKYPPYLFHCSVPTTCRGSFMSGHFIWNLWNEPLASFINFIWNDRSCKILFIIQLYYTGFYCLKSGHYFNRKHYVVTDVIMTLRTSNQVLCNVVIRFLWHDVSHWITATSYDNSYYGKIWKIIPKYDHDTTNLQNHAKRRLRSACTSTQSNQSLGCPHETLCLLTDHTA